MKEKRFAYVFPMGSKVVWSGERGDQLLEIVDNQDKGKISEFIDYAQPGDFITLSTGEMAFCIRT